MKTRLPLALLAFALGNSISYAANTPANDLGTLMYVGDSITHGVNSASYRWALHKIFADNGISYDAVGIMSGNYSGGITAGTNYGGQTFNNVHSSQASARAYEISGRPKSSTGATDNQYGRFGNSNILNWLGQSTELTNSNGTYTGETFTGDNAPDTYFMLIGTNDLLSNTGWCFNEEKITGLLGDMDTIVNSMTTANANANIYVLEIPCWTQHGNSNDETYHSAVAAYNERLKTWSEGHSNVTTININKGIIDVAASTSFYGCSSMFNNPGTDGLHPNAQGDLIIAGNVAKSLGYAGRSAGQVRVDNSQFKVNFYNGTNAPQFSTSALSSAGFILSNGVQVNTNAISMGKGDSITTTWAGSDTLDKGFTFDFNFNLGDAVTGEFTLDNALSIYLGTDTFYGNLNIDEAYIKWGNTVLYSMDMSENSENIRLSYITGNVVEGLQAGYYVWLGDMLIGEALSVTEGSTYNGLTINYNGDSTLTINDLALDGTRSYAPTTNNYINEASAYFATNLVTEAATPQGNQTWMGGQTATASKTGIALSGQDSINARAEATTIGGNGVVVQTEITSGSANQIYANSGNFTGDAGLTISAGGKANSWYGAHSSGTLTGDASLRFTDNAVGGSTVFGAVNATTVTGNVYLEFSAQNAKFDTSFTNVENNKSSIVGSYQSNIDGNVDIVVNSGEFSYQVLGGIHTGAKTIGGNTSVYVNGGSLSSNIYGGGFAGTIKGNSQVTITGGFIEGHVYGGGRGDTIEGNSSVNITSGGIAGNVYGGGESGTIGGESSVTITGNLAAIGGNIYAGSADGSFSGNSKVVIKDLYSGNFSSGFDRYNKQIVGTYSPLSRAVTGTSTLVLDNVKVDSFNAQLSNFSHIEVTGGTNTTLSSLGGASTLSLDTGSALALTSATDLTSLILRTNSAFSTTGFLADSVIVDISEADNYILTLTDVAADVDLSNIQFYDGIDYYAATMAYDAQAMAGQLTAGLVIPEPATVSLSLLGLVGLLSRRRRA